MAVGLRGDLRKVRHAQHLTVASHLSQFLPHLLGCPAADSGINLIENQRIDVILVSQHVLDGKHDAGKLSSGCDFGNWLGRLTGIGRDQEFDFIASRRIQVAMLLGNLQPNTRHIQKRKLRRHTLHKDDSGLSAFFGKRNCKRFCLGTLLLIFFLKPGAAFIGKLNGIQFFFSLFQIREHILLGFTVFEPESIERIQPFLDPIDFLRITIDLLGVAAQILADILQLVGDFHRAVSHALQRGQISGRLGKQLRNLGELLHGAGRLLFSCKYRARGSQICRNFFGIGNHHLASGKLLVLADRNLCLLKFIDLVLQQIDAVLLVLRIQIQRIELMLDFHHAAISLIILFQLPLKVAKAIQIVNVQMRRKQLLVFVLAVDIDKAFADIPYHGRRCRNSVHPKTRFAVLSNFALDQYAAFFLLQAKLVERGARSDGNFLKKRRNPCFFRTCPDQLLAGSFAQHRVKRINDNRFSRSGFAGEYVETGMKIDGCAFNHRNIFNIQVGQHCCAPFFEQISPTGSPYFTSSFFNSETSETAAFSFLVTIKIVSSPASVPTTPSQCMESSAAQTACAIPTRQRMTTMFPAKSIVLTESLNSA